jgi:hypothetical protein
MREREKNTFFMFSSLKVVDRKMNEIHLESECLKQSRREGYSQRKKNPKKYAMMRVKNQRFRDFAVQKKREQQQKKSLKKPEF